LPAQLDAEAALQICQARKMNFLLAWPALLLGRIYRDREVPDLKKSEEFLNQAADSIERHQNRPLYWELAFDRAMLAKTKGEKDLAQTFLENSLGALENYLQAIPETLRQSYLRDLKVEKLREELKNLQRS